MPMKKKYVGVTLIEILLALVVSGAIVVMSLRMYGSYQKEVEVTRLKNTVNLLFQAMNSFYRANCIEYKNGAALIKRGRLYPGNFPVQSSGYTVVVPVDIKKDLVDAGYLALWPLPFNSLVDLSTPGRPGYFVQFNLERPAYYGDKPRPRNITMSQPPSPQDIGYVYVWRIQISVKMKNPETTTTYYTKLAGADCGTNYHSDDSVIIPCNRSLSTWYPYIAWERLPGMRSVEANADLWVAEPTVTQFTQMYTTYPILDLTNKLIPNQYYLCNG